MTLYVYYIYLIWITIFEKINKNLKMISFVSSILLLSLITGSRKNVGGYDYYIYKAFYNYPLTFNPWEYDIGFVVLKKICRNLSLTYNGFLMIISIISSFITYIIFTKYSRWPIFSLFVYYSLNYFWQNFTILRSSLSILIFWIGFEAIKEKKLLKYIFLIFLATCFHRTSFPIILIYFIVERKLYKNLYFIIFLALFLNILTPIILPRITFLNSLWSGDKVNGMMNVKINGYNPLIILEQGMITFFSIKYLKESKKNIFFLNLSVINLFIMISFFRIPSLMRYTHYFYISNYILLPELIYNNKKLKNTVIVCIIIFVWFNIRFIKNTITYNLIDYTSWLF